jgi:uncharacterized protein involved in exopolysaccharide biosynthesis
VKGLSPGDGRRRHPAIQQNNYIQSLKSHVADLERERANLAERYGERHPEIIKINASIRDARASSKPRSARRSKAIATTTRRRWPRSARSSVARGPEGAAMSLSRKNVSYTVLEREAQSNRQVYESLLQRPEGAAGAGEQPRQQRALVDEARVPRAPFLPT